MELGGAGLEPPREVRVVMPRDSAMPQRCCSGPSVVHYALKNERRTVPTLIAPEPVQEPLSQIALLKFDQSVRFAIVSPFGHPFRCPWRPDGLFVL